MVFGMVFGFGFNKAKVLASAERNVKQGKLNNAIADYEKISKEDPKDLNNLNTLGDLYARVGNLEQAAACFKRVGDVYAGDGFTVKAIAMYKKLTKHTPHATDTLLKLAELYTQQGLYNDARVQYTLVADQYLASNETESAAAVLQKMLDFDGQNPQLQVRLADLYVRLGKKAEARDIYFRSAESLRSRGVLPAADEMLQRVLQLDPGFAQAALLRGQIKLELEDAPGAVQCLEALPDIDSRPEGLRILLRAQLKLGNHAEAESLAQKLLKVHNDPSGIPSCAELLTNVGEYDEALRLYREHADRLLAADAAAVVAAMHALIGRVKSNPRALELLSELFQKAGDTTDLADVTELLAHAYVQEGALTKARDLYQKLAEIEPENPLHRQNYRQIAAKLGEEAEPPAASGGGEDAETLLLDELEPAASAIEQNYPAPVRSAVREALTDSELFASYNLPARAIRPLESVLSQAPDEAQVNQRLASLYVRLGRPADAARCCGVLQRVYAKAGQHRESEQYAQLADKYRERAGLPAGMGDADLTPPAGEPRIEAATPLPPGGAEIGAAQPQPPRVTAAVAETDPQAQDLGKTKAGQFDQSNLAAASAPSTPVTVPAEGVRQPGMPLSAPPDANAHEIDLSEEWDRVMSASQPAAATVAVWEAAPQSAAPAPEQPIPAQDAGGMDAALGDLVQEVEFYRSQQMWEEAEAALVRAEALAPNAPAVVELRSQLALARNAEPAAPGFVEIEAAEPVPDVQPAPETYTAAAEPLAHAPSGTSAPQFATCETTPEMIHAGTLTPAETSEESVAATAESPSVAERAGLGQIDAAEVLAAAFPEGGLPSADESLIPPTPVDDDESKIGARQSAPDPLPSTGVAAAPDDLLDSLAMELEESFSEDLATSAADTAADPVLVGPAAISEPPVEPAAVPVGATAVSSSAPPNEPLQTAAVAATGMEQSASLLSDLFAEFKQDVEADVHDSEDPETHYNLGVAFKEMGLLDEAIGELQKVCQTVEQGTVFGQTVQAYTWLAHCFVEKGIPEAGIRWYEKALAIPTLAPEQATAIHYELACAEQTTGNLGAARQHFMQVLSVNIDYRDVAERIKALKS